MDDRLNTIGNERAFTSEPDTPSGLDKLEGLIAVLDSNLSLADVRARSIADRITGIKAQDPEGPAEAFSLIDRMHLLIETSNRINDSLNRLY